MRCIFCYIGSLLITNAKPQAKKGLILYNNVNGVTSFLKKIYVQAIVWLQKYLKKKYTIC
jgi:hypothetical protein